MGESPAGLQGAVAGTGHAVIAVWCALSFESRTGSPQLARR